MSTLYTRIHPLRECTDKSSLGPIANGSVMEPLEAVGDYAIQFVKKMQVRRTVPEPQYNEHRLTFLERTDQVNGA